METIRMGLKPILGALDIGSTKITFIVAEALQDGFKVLGTSTVKHDGVRQGAIVNISKTTEAIKKAKREVELSSGHDLKEVYVSFGGLHIRSFNTHGMAAVENEEVSARDVQNVLKVAKAILLPDDREILHALPKEYILDQQREIQNPIGMQGVRLEADVHLITGLRTAFPNMLKCIEANGLKVKDFVLQQYASSLAILSEEEKELGVCLVEMGGGTCEWIVYEQGMVAATGAVAVGGANFTHDLSVGLRTPFASAEKIKLDYGNCYDYVEADASEISVEEVGGREPRSIEKRQLTEILAPRAQEAISVVLQDIERAGFLDRINAGVVLTGGASQLLGLADFSANYFNRPFRVGKPAITTSVNEVISLADFSCALGLIKYGYSKLNRLPKRSVAQASSPKRPSTKIESSFESWGKQFKDFIGL